MVTAPPLRFHECRGEPILPIRLRLLVVPFGIAMTPDGKGFYYVEDDMNTLVKGS